MLLLQIKPFEPRKDSVLQDKEIYSNLKISASGSIGQYYNSKCNPTYPNITVSTDNSIAKYDWCSNVAPDRDHPPWIQYDFGQYRTSLVGYSLRAGCCYYGACCLDDNTYMYDCCCSLYTFSLRGSNDNVTWDVLHRVEKDVSIEYCSNAHYDFPKTKPYKYVRLVQEEPYKGCKHCMILNRLEFYGVSEKGDPMAFDALDDMNDEEISIIGKVRNH